MPLRENRLSWSKSRAEVFAHCLRKYWWTYYGSWGGWSADASPEARDAWLLKSLHSRWTWVGNAVHGAIERLLLRLRDAAIGDGLALEGGSEVDPDAEVEALREGMRAEFRASREGRYRADPRRWVGLSEHEYGVPVPDAEWKDMSRRAAEGLRGFLASPTFASIRASDPRTWLSIEALDSFDFEGVPVWLALDFSRRAPGGPVEVYDWKTGEERIEENTPQMLAYALYCEARHGIPATTVVARLVYVNTGRVHEVRPTERDVASARASIRASIAEMRQRLAMGGGSDPNRLAFPMTEDRDKCAACAFRRLCSR